MGFCYAIYSVSDIRLIQEIGAPICGLWAVVPASGGHMNRYQLKVISVSFAINLGNPGYMSRKFEGFERINSIEKQTEVLTHAVHVNNCFPAVYMSYTSQNFRLLPVSNLSVQTFEFFFSCIQSQ